VGPAALSPVSTSACHVRGWPCLLVHREAPLAGGPNPWRLASVGRHHDDQRRDSAPCRHDDVAGRRGSIPARAAAGHSPGGLDWGLAVFCPASVLGSLVVVSGRLGPARRLVSRQLVLLPARRAALVHGKYRHSPCAPLVQRSAVLPAAPGPARPPGARCRRPAHAVGEPSLRPPRALGRRLATANLVPRPALPVLTPVSVNKEPGRPLY